MHKYYENPGNQCFRSSLCNLFQVMDEIHPGQGYKDVADLVWNRYSLQGRDRYLLFYPEKIMPLPAMIHAIEWLTMNRFTGVQFTTLSNPPQYYFEGCPQEELLKELIRYDIMHHRLYPNTNPVPLMNPSLIIIPGRKLNHAVVWCRDRYIDNGVEKPIAKLEEKILSSIHIFTIEN